MSANGGIYVVYKENGRTEDNGTDKERRAIVQRCPLGDELISWTEEETPQKSLAVEEKRGSFTRGERKVGGCANELHSN